MQRKSTESKPYQTSKMECFCKYFSPSHSEKLPNNLRISNYVFPRIFQLNISMPTRIFVKKHCVKSVQTRNFSGTNFPLFSQKKRKMTQKNSLFEHFSRSEVSPKPIAALSCKNFSRVLNGSFVPEC